VIILFSLPSFQRVQVDPSPAGLLGRQDQNVHHRDHLPGQQQQRGDALDAAVRRAVQEHYKHARIEPKDSRRIEIAGKKQSIFFKVAAFTRLGEIRCRRGPEKEHI
jgi:hypothetical protein